jgi:hypothetical protein
VTTKRADMETAFGWIFIGIILVLFGAYNLKESMLPPKPDESEE